MRLAEDARMFPIRKRDALRLLAVPIIIVLILGVAVVAALWGSR